jgi:coenzyme F420-reducing hydrogenase beta subunit
MMGKKLSSSVITATPCVLLGIKKVIDHFKIGGDFLFLGLFCHGVYNLNIYNYFEQVYARKDEAIAEFEFKSKIKSGWPGNVRIVFDSGRQAFVSKIIRRQLWPFFMPLRCDLCFDRFNSLADISFGDCYVKSEKRYEGTSNIIVRGGKGKRVFEQNEHLFHHKPIAIDQVEQSQQIEQVQKRYQRAVGYERIVNNDGPEDAERMQFEQEHRKLLSDRKLGDTQQYRLIRLVVYFRLLRYFSYLSVRKIYRLNRQLIHSIFSSSRSKRTQHHV